MTAPVRSPARIAAHHGQPWFLIMTPITAPAGAGGEAGRQVDLAQEKHENQPHGDDHDRGALLDEIGEVQALVKVSGRRAVNTSTSTIAPSTAGNEPTSPPRNLLPVVVDGAARCRTSPPPKSWISSGAVSTSRRSCLTPLVGPGVRCGVGRRGHRGDRVGVAGETLARQTQHSPVRPAVISSTTSELFTETRGSAPPSGPGRGRRCCRPPQARRSCCG